MQKKTRIESIVIRIYHFGILTSYIYRLFPPNLTLDLLLEQLLQSDRVRRELGDTLTELLRGHGILVQFEAEQSLILDVAALGDVKARSIGCVELLGDRVGRVVELLQEVGLRWVLADDIEHLRQIQHTEMVR